MMEATTIMMAMAAVSGVVGAVGSIQAGNAQSAALERNAEVGKVNAGSQLAQSEAEAARQQTANQRRIATATNAAAGSGVDVGSGSPLDVMGDLAAEGALDEQITRWKGRRAADAYRQQSTNDSAAADQASTAGYLNAGTTLLTTAGRAYGNYKFPTARAI